MRLRFFIDSVIRDRDKNPHYEPVGVWVQGPGPGLDIVMEYTPSDDPAVLEAKEEADWVINRLVENGVKELPADFLEYHRQTLSPYRGSRTPVAETTDFSSTEIGAKAILAKMSVRAGISS
jgi:hypothetical protein